MKTTALDALLSEDTKGALSQLQVEARAELQAWITQEHHYEAAIESLEAQLAAKDAALEALFQACANLPVEYMDKMEKEINAASKALKGTQE